MAAIFKNNRELFTIVARISIIQLDINSLLFRKISNGWNRRNTNFPFDLQETEKTTELQEPKKEVFNRRGDSSGEK